jgi:ABC-type nitrate/sulfonate/bicarbonate transport system substrate-binding protein
VTLLAGGGDIDPLVPVVAGKAFVSAPSAASVAGAIKQGATLTIFATDTQKQPSAIISLAAKPLKTPADMVGKKIGVNSATLVSFNAFLAANKIDTGKVQVVPYNYDTSILTGGSVDALYGYSYDEPVTLGLQGQQTETFLFSDFNYNVLNNAWTVPSSVLKDTQQRAQVVALMAGLVKGWTDVINDPTGLVPGLLDKYCKELSIDPKLGIAAAKATGALIQGGGSLKNIYGLTPELIKGTIAGLAQQGSTLTEANFDTTVMDDVRASL